MKETCISVYFELIKLIIIGFQLWLKIIECHKNVILSRIENQKAQIRCAISEALSVHLFFRNLE